MNLELDASVVLDGDAGWTGFRSRPDPLVLPESVAAYAQNMRMVRGRAEVRKGMKRLAEEISAGDEPLVLPFVLGVDVSPDEDPLYVGSTLPTPVAMSLTLSVSTATATVVGHGLTTGRRVCISGATQAEYNGDFTVTRIDNNSFTYEVAGFPATPATAAPVMEAGVVVSDFYPRMTRSSLTVTVVATGHGWVTGRKINVRGADQAEYNGDFTVTRVDDDTLTFAIVSGAPLTPATGQVVLNAGPVLRNSYTGGIFAAGVFSSPKSAGTGFGSEYIVLVGADAVYLWRDGETLVTKTLPSGQTVEEDDEVQVLQAFDRLFILRAKGLAGEWVPQSITGITLSATTGTATFAAAHGLTTADRVAIEGANEAGWLGEFDVASTPTATTLTFTVGNSPATPATGTMTGRKVKAPLVWDGGSGNFAVVAGGSHAAGATYSTMRSSGVACFFNSQVVLAPTPARDTVLVSDVLDYETYDPALKSFRANAGSADRIVALHAFAEGDVFVMMRNSIYRAHLVIAADGLSIDPAQSFIELLTQEVGCRAKRTVVTAGPFIYFLADQGVYRMDLNYSDYKVRGMQVPLSDFITDILEDVNEATMDRSCAAWFNNRYWLAVPTGNSDLPNCILVWNALTNEWESKDTYPTGLHHLLVSDYGGARRLFAASRAGTLFLLDELETGDDDNAGENVLPIEAVLTTRAFWNNDVSQKRYLRAIVSATLQADSQVDLEGIFSEPDQVVALAELANLEDAAEDFSWKLPIRRPGHSMQLRFSNTMAGRWTLRNAGVEVTANRPTFRGRSVE